MRILTGFTEPNPNARMLFLGGVGPRASSAPSAAAASIAPSARALFISVPHAERKRLNDISLYQAALENVVSCNLPYDAKQGGISGLELARRLGVAQNTAWKISHKLMQVMHEREAHKKLTGRVEMNDAYIGGKRAGKRGRGATGKVPFVAAVETTDDGKPHQMKLYPVSNVTFGAISEASTALLAGECAVFTDGLPCFAAVANQEIIHIPIRTSGNKPVQDSTFNWVNTVLGNVKCALLGTYRAISGKHVPRYLSSFAYRFNRRFSLPDMFARLTYVALRTPPMPYRLLKLAEYGA